MKKGKLMVRKLLFILLLAGLSAWNAQGQKAGKIKPSDLAKLETHEDTLALLSYVMVNDSIDENRFAATKRVITSLVQALKTPNSFSYPFDRLKSISIQYPADSTFRIFTWQLYVNKDEYRYYGAIQMNNPELKLFPMYDRSFEIEEDLNQAILKPNKWYGALYYNLMQVDNKDIGRYYLLFGYDGYEFFRKRKLIDVLTFPGGVPTFGAPVFVHNEGYLAGRTLNRLMLEYSSETNVRLNYDEALGIIIHDHLQAMDGQYGEGTVNISDGTYEGYKLEKGYWNYVEKVFHEMSDEPPRPFPVLDGREKDLFGKKN